MIEIHVSYPRYSQQQKIMYMLLYLAVELAIFLSDFAVAPLTGCVD